MNFSTYLKSAFSFKKLSSNISFLALWDNTTYFPPNVFIGALTRLANTTIGKYTRVKPACSIFNAKIGNYCSIAKGVKIGLGKHPTNYLSTNSIFYKSGIRTDWASKINFQEEEIILIGNDVWIGIEAIIMDGVKIGNGAVIATRSVVTKDVPPFAIVGGVPAKVIKYRFDQETIQKIEESKWWDWTDKDIEQKLPIFTTSNPSIFELAKYLD